MPVAQEFIFAGLAFGGSNGISPGPLSLLTVSETLIGGPKEGFKVACSPLLTDLPIIIVCIFIFSRLPSRELTLALISLAGALFLFFLAYTSFAFTSTGTVQAEAGACVSRTTNVRRCGSPLARGVATNFFNPYPYLFWITVGAPYVLNLMSRGALYVTGFFLAFYLGMLGSKGIVILAAASGRQMLSSRGYLVTMRAIGVLMAVFGLKFVSQAYALWSIRL